MAEAQVGFRADLEDEGRTLIMASNLWHMRCPVGDVVKWALFYRRMRDRMDGRYAQFYAEPAAALERLATRLGMPIPPARKGKH